MKKLLPLILSFGLTTISSANYLDTWTNDNLCGWMESSATPKHMIDEVAARNISCTGGVEVQKLSSNEDNLDIQKMFGTEEEDTNLPSSQNGNVEEFVLKNIKDN